MAYDPQNRVAEMDSNSILHTQQSISEESLQKALEAMKRSMRDDLRKASLDGPVERSRTPA